RFQDGAEVTSWEIKFLTATRCTTWPWRPVANLSRSANGLTADLATAATVRAACVRSPCCNKRSDKRYMPFVMKSSVGSVGSRTTAEDSRPCPIGSDEHTAYVNGFKPNY